MTILDPGYSEAAATLLTWSADKFLGGIKKALRWGWGQAQWTAAQDSYDKAIIDQYGEIRIFGQTTPKPLREIFTNVYVLDTPTAFRRFSPADLTEHIWNEDRSFSFRHSERQPGEQLLNKGTKFFILGKPGAGKTTFLKRLAVREAQRGSWGRCLGKVPIFVSLEQYARAGKPLFDYIVDQFAVCHFPDAVLFVAALLKSGKALVLFDGLDEVARSEDIQGNRRGQVAEQLAQFAREYSSCHVVITCRIAASEYTFEPAFTYLEMADFAPEQVEAFVRAWFWDKADPDRTAALADRMLADWAVPEHNGIRDLARNPLLLTLLCLNYEETRSFPARRVELYEEALDALLKKWDNSRQVQRGSLYKTLSLGRKRQLFARIAYDAFVRNEILFQQADLETWLVTYLQHVPELPAPIDIDAEAVLQEIIAQHGIFVQQAVRLMSFSHLAFQEYYAAKYIVENVVAGTLEVLISHVTNGKWREVMLLTASLLPDAKILLTGFAAALHNLAASKPRLASLLREIDMQVVAVPVSNKPFVRLAFCEIALTRTSAVTDTAVSNHAREVERIRELEPISASDPELVHEHDTLRQYAISREIAHLKLARIIYGAHIMTAYLATVLTRSQADMGTHQQAYNGISFEDLAKAYSYTNDWIPQTEMREEDIDSYTDYIAATALYCECLRLAYTPDRSEFEAHILEPPACVN